MSSASPQQSSLSATQRDQRPLQATTSYAGSSSESNEDEVVLSDVGNVHVGQEGEEEEASSDSEAESGIRYKRRRQRIHFNVEQLQTVYHLPLKTAAERLGICEAALKRICRRNRISKWPYRQLSSVRRRISELKNSRSAMLAGVDQERSPGYLDNQELPLMVTPAQFNKKLRRLEEEREHIIRSAHQRHRRKRNNVRLSATRPNREQPTQLLLPHPLPRETLTRHIPGIQSSDVNLFTDLTRFERDFPLLFLANVCESVRAYY